MDNLSTDNNEELAIIENKEFETKKILRIFTAFVGIICMLIGRLLYISTGKYSTSPQWAAYLCFIIYLDILFIVISLIIKKKYIAKVHNVAIFVALFLSTILYMCNR